MDNSLFQRCHQALFEPDPVIKGLLVDSIIHAWNSNELVIDHNESATDIDQPGHPEKPILVSPRELSRRGIGSNEGRAALIHAIAHIEFNAINLALDAVCRYRHMPEAYYGDWLKVAAEEVKHFRLLRERLRQLDYDYGDFSAHNGLWDMAKRTEHDLLDRMAMIPRLMEARGLDVTPGMIDRFASLGDHETASILEIILEEEVGHVEAGSRWFRYLCEQRVLDAEESWLALITKYLGKDIRCPLFWDTRREAGFTESELNRMKELCSKA